MEEIRRVLAEIQFEHDARLERIERPVEEHGGGGTDLVDDDETGEEYGCTTNDDVSDDDSTDTNDDDSTDAEWDEDGRRLLPYTGRCYPFTAQPHCAAGAWCTIEGAESIIDSTCERNAVVLGEWVEMSNNNITPLPPVPLRILPNVTISCVSGHKCYHRQYWTDSSATTEPAHPYFRPCRMMQVFSLRLPKTFSHPVQIHGTCAVRDCWEPLCNYVFNRTRDDPATILPEGEMSAYKQLFRGYLEFDADLAGPKSKVYGRIPGGCYDLDMCYGFLSDAIETAIEVFADAKHLLDVKMSAFTGSFDHEVVLYDGTVCDTRVINHFVAVRKQEELHVLLQLHGSQYRWTFRAGVGVLIAPDPPMYDFAQFIMKVDFRTQGRVASAWEWSFSNHEPDFMMWGSRQVPGISVDMEGEKGHG